MTAPTEQEQQQDSSLEWLAAWLVLNHQQQQRDIAAKSVAAMLPLWKLLRFNELTLTQTAWIQAVLPVVEAGYRESQAAALDFVVDYRHARMPAAPDLPALSTPPGGLAASEFGLTADADQPAEQILSAIEAEARTASAAQPIPEFLQRGRARAAAETPQVVADTPLEIPRAVASLVGTGPGEVKRRMPAPEPESMAAGQLKSAKVATRIVTDGGRAVVQRAVQLDHDAIGWARVLNTSPCSFCAVLASRGAVFKRDSFRISDPQFEGEGVAKVHDGCRCGMRPVYSEAERWDPTAKNLLEQWKTLSKGLSNKDALRKFRREFTEPPQPDAPLIDMHSLVAQRQRLLDQGFAADSTQVAWLDEQIDRFGALINLDANPADLAAHVRARNRPRKARKTNKTPAAGSSQSRRTTSESPADRARRQLPALERLAAELVASGAAPDSSQVQRTRAQIARARKALT